MSLGLQIRWEAGERLGGQSRSAGGDGSTTRRSLPFSRSIRTPDLVEAILHRDQVIEVAVLQLDPRHW